MRKASWYVAASILAAPIFAAVPANAAEPAKAEVSDANRIVCRKLDETGSLVKKTKVCLTRAQWVRSAENHEEYGRALVDGLRGKPGGK